MLCLNFCSCYVISIVTDFQFLPKTFTFISTCLSAFLQCSTGNPINSLIFIFSLFFSLPHFPLPVAPQQISYKNFKVIIYIILTIVCNIIAIEYGALYNALSIVSDAMMSMCNCITMIGEIIADIASYLPPTKKFPYGFKRGTIICDFTVTILLIYVTFDLISTAISTLVSNDFYSSSTMSEISYSNSSSILMSSPTLVSSFLSFFLTSNKNSISSLNYLNRNNISKLNTSFYQSRFLLDLNNNTQNITNNELKNLSNDTDSPIALLYISLLGFLNNAFGVFFLGTIQIKTCTIAEDGNSMSVFTDFISSLAVVLCSTLSVCFNINYFDPFVSIFISLMILIISLSRMIKLIAILLQRIPDNYSQNDFQRDFGDDIDILPQFNSWSLDETTKVVSFKLLKKKNEDNEMIRGKIKNSLQNDPHLILTYEI